MPFVHPDRYSLSKVVRRKLGVVIHTSESGDTSHDALVALMARPGDRPYTKPDGTTGYYGSSYHAVTDGKGGFTLMLGAEAGPFSAPPCNKDRWHICMPGRAAQTREDWLDPVSRQHIRAVARFVFDCARIDGFPTVRITPAQLAAGAKGYCGHRDVTYAFNIAGGHTDPGPNFPWDVLADDISRLAQPPTEDDMARIVRICEQDSNGQWQYTHPAQFVVTGGQIEWVTSKDRRDALIAAGTATLNPATGQPYRFGRPSLRWYRLVGELPPTEPGAPYAPLSADEFFQA